MPVGLRGFESVSPFDPHDAVFSMPVGLRGFESKAKCEPVDISFRCLSA